MQYNRDLSWLGFNHRVLKEASCTEVPLLERIKFLSIFSSNLDEFFRVRYPAVLAIARLSAKTRKKHFEDVDKELTEQIQIMIEHQLEEFGKILSHDILPELNSSGTVLYYDTEILAEHKDEIREIFLSRVLSFIQPVLLNNDARDSFLPENNKLYLIVVLRKKGDENLLHSIVNIPSDRLPRFFNLSPVDNKDYIIFIDDIIRENVQFIFPGFEIVGSYNIKFNRDAELNLADEYSGDLQKKIERKLKKRDYGPPSRFLFERGMPNNIQLFVATAYNIRHEEMFVGGRYHNLRDLSLLADLVKGPTYSQQKPLVLPALRSYADVFNILDEKELLLHMPYDSYNTILAFFNQAAIDPDVTEIYITLYRVAADSHIVNALISAAKNGKKVTAFIELKARFDEANNIFWSKQMKAAGVKIIYSIPEIKVHSKIALVVKNDGLNDKAYSILSTGNFNESTARFYTDHALLTTDPMINSELLMLFHFLQGRQPPRENHTLKFNTLYVSQFNMVERFEKLIEKEIKKVKKGEPGLVRIKLNNLEEPYMIDQLYNASNAGVKVELIARSICCLVPGVKGQSENITVKRIVDRYLEHTRLFIFGTGEQATVVMGSADWMTRNLRHRIEVCAPILHEECRKQLLDYFEIQWKDTDKSVYLTPEMKQVTVSADGAETINAQQAIYQYLKQRR
ncbi:MAG: polyphosphate kinase 1 [Flavipsychrobacter sp.]|jgi:polyphosphate kinase|nr:polyphosphate kinase 1 [Flavipsychrobacter sp.]